MSSTTTMDLSVLKLTSPRRRMAHSARFTFDSDYAPSYYFTSNSTTPRGGSPPSSLSGGAAERIFDDDDDDDTFTIFEQHRAAIPFKWEEIPGTRRDEEKIGGGKGDGLKGISESEPEDYFGSNSSAISRSSSGNTGSSTTHEQDFTIGGSSPDLSGAFDALQLRSPAITLAENYSEESGNEHYRELQLHSMGYGAGGGAALKPPPGKNSIRQLLALEGDDRSNKSSIVKTRRRSFRHDGLKALSFLSTSSNRKAHNEQVPSTLLGFDDWPRVVQEHEKQEAREKLEQEKQHNNEDDGRHRRVSSASRFSFSFRKKPAKDHSQASATGASVVDLLDYSDDIFNVDLGIRGGLTERTPAKSMSSRGLADGYNKPKSWVYDSDTDYSDYETDTRNDYFDPFDGIAEEDPRDFPRCDDDSSWSQVPKSKRKKHHRNPISRVLGVSSGTWTHKAQSSHKVPPRSSRLSTVSPAASPIAAGASHRGNQKQSETTASHHAQGSAASGAVTSTNNSLLKMCLSTPIGQALFKNFRAFEFRTPRSLTAK